MKVVALDISLTSSGVCDDGALSTIQLKTTGPERMFGIRDAIRTIVEASKPDVVIIEGFSMSSHNSRAHDIGGIGWVIRLFLWESKIPYIEVPPSNLKQFATGKGNAGKDEVVSSISARTGVIFAGKGANDMCDAWVLHEMVLGKLGESKYDWPKKNLEALDKVDWSNLPI